jgi:hypothetical protein
MLSPLTGAPPFEVVAGDDVSADVSAISSVQNQYKLSFFQ